VSGLFFALVLHSASHFSSAVGAGDPSYNLLRLFSDEIDLVAPWFNPCLRTLIAESCLMVAGMEDLNHHDLAQIFLGANR
jgi:hypothetical protein